MFSKKEVLSACLKYFLGDTLAVDVWMDKYAIKDREGNFLEQDPSDMHMRLSREFARIERNYVVDPKNRSKLSEYGQQRKELDEEKIFEYFDHFTHIIPQGSIMANLGNPLIVGSLSNCVVLPELHDSYGGIMFADQQLVQLMKRRCGVGLDISSLRPANSSVSNAALTSTGAVSFMGRFSNSTREVAQSGRRGALMITMDIRHPDAKQFALAKQDIKKITGANISLKITDNFMTSVINNGEFIQQWPVESDSPVFQQTIKARELWNVIVKCAYATAEPGLIFWDRQHKYSTSSVYPQYKNISVNPCAEISTGPGDSCRLIAINLFGSVRNPFSKEAFFDYKKFYGVVYEAQRLSDDLVDLELEAIKKIFTTIENDPEPDYIKNTEKRTWAVLYESGKKGRRTGLGFTALADTLAALDLKFDSDKSLLQLDEIMRVKCQAEFDSSIDMAIERGRFNGFDPEIEKTSEFVQMLQKEFPKLVDRMIKYGRRNVSLSTVSPTGSVSIMSQTSSGIEPVYTLSYKRRRKVVPGTENLRVDFIDESGDSWQEYEVVHPKLAIWKTVTGKIDIKDSPYFKSTAEDVDWTKRLEIQAIAQKYTTHSISSTLNLPMNTSIEKVQDIYMVAWKMGLKGITIYRAGSRSGVLVSNLKENVFKENHAQKRPKYMSADVARFVNGKEKWIAFIGILNDRPYEIFTGLQEQFVIPLYVEKGKIRRIKKNNSGKYDFLYFDKEGKEQVVENLHGAFNPEFWNYSKLVSMILRHNVPVSYVVKIIDNLSFPEVLTTWRSGVSRSLKKYMVDGTLVKGSVCTICGNTGNMIFEGGCLVCRECGWSKCD